MNEEFEEVKISLPKDKIEEILTDVLLFGAFMKKKHTEIEAWKYIDEQDTSDHRPA